MDNKELEVIKDYLTTWKKEYPRDNSSFGFSFNSVVDKEALGQTKAAICYGRVRYKRFEKKDKVNFWTTYKAHNTEGTDLWLDFLLDINSPYKCIFPYLYSNDYKFIKEYGFVFTDIAKIPFLPFYNFLIATRYPFEFPDYFKNFLKLSNKHPLNWAAFFSLAYREEPGKGYFIRMNHFHVFLVSKLPYKVYRFVSGDLKKDLLKYSFVNKIPADTHSEDIFVSDTNLKVPFLFKTEEEVQEYLKQVYENEEALNLKKDKC